LRPRGGHNRIGTTTFTVDTVAPAVIEIRVTATGVDGRAVRFKMRKNRFPKRVELCLPQSTGKPTRC
jgi:hypothetical protein